MVSGEQLGEEMATVPCGCLAPLEGLGCGVYVGERDGTVCPCSLKPSCLWCSAAPSYHCVQGQAIFLARPVLMPRLGLMVLRREMQSAALWV